MVKTSTNRLKEYAAHRWPFILVGGYLLFSVLLFIWTGLDYRIPCLVSIATGYRCPGCGLTSAFGAIITADFVGAMGANPLIYILLPAGSYYLIRDLRRDRHSCH